MLSRSENIQQATLKLLHHLFGSYGLIVLIPDNRLLKSVMRGVFKDDLTSHIPFKITEENMKRLIRKISGAGESQGDKSFLSEGRYS